MYTIFSGILTAKQLGTAYIEYYIYKNIFDISAAEWCNERLPKNFPFYLTLDSIVCFTVNVTFFFALNKQKNIKLEANRLFYIFSCSLSFQTNKPIMEKRRRARINHCLNELKSLILEAMKKDVS